MQFCRHGGRQTQADALAADTREHFVADEVGVESVYFSGADTGEFKQQRIDLRLGAGVGGINTQGRIAMVVRSVEYSLTFGLSPGECRWQADLIRHVRGLANGKARSR